MTNKEAVTYGNELIQCTTGQLREFAEIATRALRSPGAGAMREAILLLRDASYQNHTGHFDKTGGSGSGCPECIRARDLRDKADAILRALPLPAPEVPEALRGMYRLYKTWPLLQCEAPAIFFKEWFEKEYPDACK